MKRNLTSGRAPAKSKSRNAHRVFLLYNVDHRGIFSMPFACRIFPELNIDCPLLLIRCLFGWSLNVEA